MPHNEAHSQPDQFPRDMGEVYTDLAASIVAGAGEVITSERGLLQHGQPDEHRDRAVSSGDDS